MNYAVFGGSQGIGFEVAQQLIGQGHTVWVYSRSGNGPVGAHTIAWDAVEDAAVEIAETLDGVVYAPGSINLKPFRGLKIDEFRKDLEINFLGAVKALQLCLPALKLSPSASVVLFSTVAVAQGMPFHASIASAKGAVEGLVRSLAAELAPNIRVNAVAPSLVNTPLASRLLSSPEKIEASGKRHPLQRVGEARDIANAVLFLLNPENTWITGQILAVDGGMSALKVG